VPGIGTAGIASAADLAPEPPAYEKPHHQWGHHWHKDKHGEHPLKAFFRALFHHKDKAPVG